jgi:hypothetical protein
MSDDVERELEAMLRDRADAVSQTAEPPVDLDAQVGRHRQMARRRRAIIGGLALAAVLAATVATVAALSDGPAKKRVDVVHPPTTIGASGTDPLPKGTMLLAVDDNGHVLALDAHGEPLKTLLDLPKPESPDPGHPGQALLTPDHHTLWAVSPAAASADLCTDGIEHDLVADRVGRTLAGRDFALSPDGTLLAYTECAHDVLHVRDLRTDAEWTAPTPTDLRNVSFLAVSPDNRRVVVELFVGGDVETYEIHLTGKPGKVAWGKVFEKVRGEALLTAASDHLYGVPLRALNSPAGPRRVDVFDWSFKHTGSIDLPEGLVPGDVVPAGDKVFVLARPSGNLTPGGLFDLAGGRRLRTDIVSVIPARAAPAAGRGGPVPTTVPRGGRVPDNATFLVLDSATGDVVALDENGKEVRALFASPMKRFSRETIDHPIIGNLQLSPDRNTLWYSVNEAETCPVIVERNLTTGKTQEHGKGDAFALSPDFTRLAYNECNIAQSVRVRELATNKEWIATLPAGKYDPAIAPINEVEFAGVDNRIVVLLRGQQGAKIDELVLPNNPGSFGWGRTVITEPNLRWFSATPQRLFLSVSSPSPTSPTEMVDTYDWSFRRVSRRELPVVVETVSVVGGNEYVVGDEPLGQSRALYRLEADGRATRLRENVEEITPVTP